MTNSGDDRGSYDYGKQSCGHSRHDIVARAGVYILNKVSGGDITGIFAGIPQGGTVVGSDGTVFSVNYNGGDGNDIVLTVVAAPVPEPSTWMAVRLRLLGSFSRSGADCGS